MKTTRKEHVHAAHLAGALCLACACLLPSPAISEEEAAAPDEAAVAEPAATNQPATGAYGEAQVHARLRMEYDYRTQGDFNDSDLYGYFYGSAKDLQKGLIDIYTSARLHSDLDSSSSSSLADDPFHSLDDSDGVTEDRLLQLYADIHNRRRSVAFRGGRQYIDIADYILVDGGQLMLFEDGKFGGRAYLGHPVSYYSSVSGDMAGGLSLIGRPWAGNQTRFTFARYEDDSADGTDQDYYLDLRQELSEENRIRGQLSVLNEDFRMGRLDAYHISMDGETDLSLGGSYWGQFDARTRAYSPLYSAVGSLQPYAYTYARLTQQIVPTFLISPGVSLRFAETGDNDFNNRDYQNYDITFIYEPVRAFSASIALEYWSVEDSDSFFGVSGDVRYRFRRVWEVSGGAAYAAYNYDTFSDLSYSVNGGQTVFTENGTVIEESPYVKTYFVRAKWKLSKMLILRAQFDVEDDDIASDLAYRGRTSIEVRY